MLNKPTLFSKIRISHRMDLPRSRLRSPLGMTLVAAPMLAVLAAFAIAPQEAGHGKEQWSELAVALAPAVTSEVAFYSRAERVARGDTAAMALNRLSINDDAAVNWISADRYGRQLASLPAGALLHARVDAAGALQELRFRTGQDREVLIQRTGSGFASEERALPLHTRVETRSGVVNGSLFSALDRAGIPDDYARQLITIFSGDIDFHRGLKRGDHFSLVYEILVDDYGSEVRPGRLLAANFVNGGEEHAAIAFTLTDGKTEYFTPQGESLKRAFLKNPVEFSRISSGFSGSRLHPVLQTMRAHKGVDYAAPVGSKVRATADGSIAFMGVQGGYGNVVIIRHDNTYSTVYGHLNGFARGLRTGSRVTQGDTIGFVGMTGLASGPHLHYEFRVRDSQIDPLSATVPLATTLDGKQEALFQQQADKLKQDLALQASPAAESFE